MASKIVRTVNVIPAAKIKKEIFDTDDDCIQCKLCNKGFASEMALQNHAKIEHIEAWLSGEDIQLKIAAKPNPKKVTAAQLKEAIKNMKEMVAANGTLDADLSYVVVKDESIPSDERDVKRPKIEKGVGEKSEKREKIMTPITGPFECLQPSNFVSHGTCHQMFFTCCSYSAHHRDEHARRRRRLRCLVCELPLPVAGAAGAAANAAAGAGAGAGEYACATCGATFDSSESLSDHSRTAHVKAKPYQCTVCNKRFTQRGGLQQHTRGHNGDKPFPCTYCGKAFTQKSGLDQHLRIHTKFKPYRCVICNKTFCQSVHLQQHMRTHTNVAPFECTVCHKRFKQSSHLNYHLKYHNPNSLNDEQNTRFSKLMHMVNGGSSGDKNQDGVRDDSVVVQRKHDNNVQSDQSTETEQQNYVKMEVNCDLVEQNLIEDSLELVQGQRYVEISDLLGSHKVEGGLQANNIYIYTDENGIIKTVDVCKFE